MDPEALEEVAPAVGPLDGPLARLSAHAPDERLFASPSSVPDDASIGGKRGRS